MPPPGDLYDPGVSCVANGSSPVGPSEKLKMDNGEHYFHLLIGYHASNILLFNSFKTIASNVCLGLETL